MGAWAPGSGDIEPLLDFLLDLMSLSMHSIYAFTLILRYLAML